jgi:hypothetical protein
MSLPFASVHVIQDGIGRMRRVEVRIDGEPVAQLAVSSLSLAASAEKPGNLTLTFPLLREFAGIETEND